MNIPNSIKILGYTYKIVIAKNFREAIEPYIADEDRDQEFFGYFATECLTIFINGNVPKTVQESTLIHEVIEILTSNLEMTIDHDEICRLEMGLHQVIVDNFHRSIE